MLLTFPICFIFFDYNECVKKDTAMNVLFVQTIVKYPCIYNCMSDYLRRDVTDDVVSVVSCNTNRQ
jgi:glyceraldehyde-3-phosphate dehydrogenase/erythrose-4-phosphate dehydrogenase